MTTSEATLLKFGDKDSNGRIYAENLLIKELEKFQEVIKNKDELKVEIGHFDLT